MRVREHVDVVREADRDLDRGEEVPLVEAEVGVVEQRSVVEDDEEQQIRTGQRDEEQPLPPLALQPRRGRRACYLGHRIPASPGATMVTSTATSLDRCPVTLPPRD